MTWCYSTDEEHFHGEYETRDAAIAEGVDALDSDLEVGGSAFLWVGETAPVDVVKYLVEETNIDDIGERVEERIFDELCAGFDSDGPVINWPEGEAGAEWDAEWEAFCRQQVAKFKLAANWFGVKNVEELTATLTPQDDKSGVIAIDGKEFSVDL